MEAAPGTPPSRTAHQKWIFSLPFIGLLFGIGFYLPFPKKYESRAVFQPNNYLTDSQLITEAYFSRAFSPAYPEPYTSSRLLKSLIAELNLTQQWKVNEEEAIEILKSRITVEQKSNASKHTVCFTHSHPQEAQLILNTLVNLHLYKRIQEEAKRAKNQLEALQAEIEDQRIKVQNDQGTEKFASSESLLKALIEKQIEERELFKTPPIPIKILEPASLPTRPVTPNLFLTLAIGLLAGSLLLFFLLRKKPQLKKA